MFNSSSVMMDENIGFNLNFEVNEEIVATTVALFVVGGIITYVIANDATGVGVADDWLLAFLIPLIFILGGEI